MSYASRRHIIHIDKYGVTNRLEFHQKGFVGESVGMLADADQRVAIFDQKRIDTRSDKGPRVLDASLDVHQILENITDEQLLEDIFAGDEDDFLLVWKKDDVVHWTGSFMNDLFDGKEAAYPWTGVATAKDFSLLKGKDYQLSDERKPIIEVLGDLLSALPFQLDIETATAWQHGDTASTADFLQTTFMDTYGLREYARTSDEQDETITHYKALEWICENFLLYIKQEYGVWRVFQEEAYEDPTKVFVTVYNPDGSEKTAGVETNLLHNYDGNNYIIKTDGTNTRGVSAVRRARVKFDHRTQVSGLTLPSSPIFLDDTDNTYTLSQFFVSGGEQRLKFGVRLSALSTADVESGSVRIVIRVGDYYWTGSDWSLSSSSIFIPLTGSGVLFDATRYAYSGNASISTSNIPLAATGQMIITIHNGIISANPDIVADSTQLFDFSFKIINPLVQENSTSIDYELSQSPTRGLSRNIDLRDVKYGEGPVAYSRAPLRYSIFSTDLIVGTWGRRGQTMNQSFFQLYLRGYLDARRNHTKAIAASTWGVTDTRRVEHYRDRYFIYGGGVFDIGDGDWSTADLIEIKVQSATTDTFNVLPQFTEDGSGSTGGGGTSGGGSGPAPNPGWNDIIGKPTGEDAWAGETGFDERYLNESQNLNDLPDKELSRANLGVEIGKDVQAWSEVLDTYVVTPLNEAELGFLQGINQSLSKNDIVEFQEVKTGVIKSSGDIVLNANEGLGNVFLNGETVKVDKQLSTADSIILINADDPGPVMTPEYAGLEIFNPGGTNYFHAFRRDDEQIVLGDSTTPVSDWQPLLTRRAAASLHDEGLFIWDQTQLQARTVEGLLWNNNGLDVPGDIRFLGAQTQVFQQGWEADGGAGGRVGESGHAEFDSIKVRGRATFEEVVIKQLSSIGGEDILSIANGVVEERNSGSIPVQQVGTITTDTSSATVTGTGTNFTSLPTPFNIYDEDFQLIGEVGTVVSDTEATLFANANFSVTGSNWYLSNLVETVSLEDPSGSNASALAVGDLVLVARFDSNTRDFIRREFRRVRTVSGNTVSFSALIDAPAPATLLRGGDVVVTFGNDTDADRQNIIFRSVLGLPVQRFQSGIDSYEAFITPADTTDFASGNLNGLYDYVSDIQGVGIGKRGNEHVTIDPTNGVRIFNDSGDIGAQMSGNIFRLGTDGVGGVDIEIFASRLDLRVEDEGQAQTMAISDRVVDDVQFVIDSDSVNFYYEPASAVQLPNNNDPVFIENEEIAPFTGGQAGYRQTLNDEFDFRSYSVISNQNAAPSNPSTEQMKFKFESGTGGVPNQDYCGVVLAFEYYDGVSWIPLPNDYIRIAPSELPDDDFFHVWEDNLLRMYRRNLGINGGAGLQSADVEIMRLVDVTIPFGGSWFRYSFRKPTNAEYTSDTGFSEPSYTSFVVSLYGYQAVIYERNYRTIVDQEKVTADILFAKSKFKVDLSRYPTNPDLVEAGEGYLDGNTMKIKT